MVSRKDCSTKMGTTSDWSLIPVKSAKENLKFKNLENYLKIN